MTTYNRNSARTPIYVDYMCVSNGNHYNFATPAESCCGGLCVGGILRLGETKRTKKTVQGQKLVRVPLL